MRPAVYLDRDDTLILNRSVTASSAHPGDLFHPALVALAPAAAEACAALRDAGFALVVVSNQGAVARGACTAEDVEATNRRMRELLWRSAAVRLDACYWCPFHPAGTVPGLAREHPWRKPAPGMLLAAAAALRLDHASSWMIGDAPRDIEAAVNAGIPPAQALLLGHEGLTLALAAERVISRRA